MRNSVACTLSLAVLVLLQTVSPLAAPPAAATDILSVYSRLERFVGSDTGTGLFGDALDFDGDTIVVSDSNLQAVYVFTFDENGIISQQARLVASDGAASDLFGTSVAIAGDTVVVGAPLANSIKGAVYVFERTGTTWDSGTKLTGSDSGVSDNFGFAVDTDGNSIVVGAPNHDLSSTGEDGAAYIYSASPRIGARVWGEQKITASDAAAADNFGGAVAIGDGRAVVGAIGDESGTGAAYVFGGALVIRGGRAAGADAGGGAAVGVAHASSSSSWTQEAKLTGDAVVGDEFGTDVGISGGSVIVGSRLATVDPVVGMEGAAYVFSAPSWAQEAKLTADDGASLDNFGRRVAIDADLAIVGSHADDDNGLGSGSAYVYQRDTGFARTAKTVKWVQRDKLHAAGDGAASEAFGNDVAIQGGYALAAAFGDAPGGAAYLFADPAALVCGYLVDPTSISSGRASTTKNVTIATSVGCTWQAASSANWVNVIFGGQTTGTVSGVGPDTIQIKVDRNDTGAPRRTTVAITGEDGFTQTITVGQGTGGATVPALTVAPRTVVVPRQPVAATRFTVTATEAQYSVAFAPNSMVMQAQASGASTVDVLLKPNSSQAPRQATMTVCLQSFPAVCDTATLVQAGAIPPMTNHYSVPRLGAGLAEVAVLGNLPAARRRGMLVQAYEGDGSRAWNFDLDEVAGPAGLTSGDLDGDGKDEIVVAGADASGVARVYVRSTSGEPRGTTSAGTTPAVTATPMVLRVGASSVLALGVVAEDGSATVQIWRYGGSGRLGARGRFQPVATYEAAPTATSEHHFEAVDVDGDGDEEVLVGYSNRRGDGAWFRVVGPESGAGEAVKVAGADTTAAAWMTSDFRPELPGAEVLVGLTDEATGQGQVRLYGADGTRLLAGRATPRGAAPILWQVMRATVGQRSGGSLLAVAHGNEGGRAQVRLLSLSGKRVRRLGVMRLDADRRTVAAAAGNYDGDGTNGDELALLLEQPSGSTSILFVDQAGTTLGSTEAFDANYFEPGIVPIEILQPGRIDAVLLGRTVDARPQVVVISVDGTERARFDVLTRGVR